MRVARGAFWGLLTFLAVAATAGRVPVAVGLRGRDGGVAAGPGRQLLEQDRRDQLEQRVLIGDQGPVFGQLRLGCLMQHCTARLQLFERVAQRCPVHRGHEWSYPLGLDRHDRRQHGEALGAWHPGVAASPVGRLALDLLAMRAIASGEARPMHPVGLEVEPDLLGDHARLVVDLQRDRPPVGQALVIERRGVAGEHDPAGQPLE